MKPGSRQIVLNAVAASALAMMGACLMGVALAGGQTGSEQKPMMSEDAFKNVQVLKGISVSQFMGSMGFFCASLGESCEYCHTLEHGTWSDYAADTPRKQTARDMVVMTNAINKTNFGGRRVVNCYSCHNGGDRPKLTPSLTAIYATPPPEDPDDAPLGPAPKTTAADQILDNYIQAVGGAQKLASITSFVAKGTSEGYGDEAYERKIEVFARSPEQRTTVIHTITGDNTTAFDGRAGWVAAPATAVPVPVLALAGSDLDAAKLDADLSFPAQLKQALTGWRVGRAAAIEGHAVQVVQGMSGGGTPVRLYFDAKSGLLVRQLRYTDSAVGLNSTRIDYGDYREVAGVKIPFHWTVTWFDGRTSFDLKDVQVNVPVDAARFARPNPPVATPQPKP